jgi:hypothetical protein
MHGISDTDHQHPHCICGRTRFGIRPEGRDLLGIGDRVELNGRALVPSTRAWARARARARALARTGWGEHRRLEVAAHHPARRPRAAFAGAHAVARALRVEQPQLGAVVPRRAPAPLGAAAARRRAAPPSVAATLSLAAPAGGALAPSKCQRELAFAKWRQTAASYPPNACRAH